MRCGTIPTSLFSGSVSRSGLKGVEHDGGRRLQRRDERRGRVEAALLGGAKNGREDLLGLRATGRAIAAAAHLASDHRRSQGVLGAPVGGIERGIEEEAEDGVEFEPEMGREAAGVGEAAGPRARATGRGG